MTSPTNDLPIKPGDILLGYCNGFFGRDYDNKVVVASGPDWIVARGEDGMLALADFTGMPPGTITQYVSEWLKEENEL